MIDANRLKDLILLYYSHKSLQPEVVEELLENINELESHKDDLKAMLQHEIIKGYESDKFEVVERVKTEWENPVEAEDHCYLHLKEDAFTKKLKSPTQIAEMLRVYPKTKETVTTFLRKIPISEKALEKRKQYDSKS